MSLLDTINKTQAEWRATEPALESARTAYVAALETSYRALHSYSMAQTNTILSMIEQQQKARPTSAAASAASSSGTRN